MPCCRVVLRHHGVMLHDHPKAMLHDHSKANDKRSNCATLATISELKVCHSSHRVGNSCEKYITNTSFFFVLVYAVWVSEVGVYCRRFVFMSYIMVQMCRLTLYARGVMLCSTT